MKKKLIVSVIVISVIVVVWAIYAFAQYAQTSDRDWSNLRIITYASGLTGFFNPDTGMLYVYDLNIEKPIMVRQLVGLGASMIKVKDNY
jgi:hypothetical protein